MANPDTDHHRKYLAKGSHVEVCSDEEGFRGAWFSATVVETPPKSSSKKRKKAFVQYSNLLAEDGSSPLTEYVDPDYVRPPPPQYKDSERGFELNDVVDAKYKDAWWTGVVTKVLDKSMFRVYFDSPPDVIDFEMKDLRLHWKWIGGKWVQAGKRQLAGSVFSSGTAVEVNLDKDDLRDIWFPAIVIKEIEKNNFLVKYKPSRSNFDAGVEKVVVDSLHIRPPPPRYVDRNYELLEKVDAACNSGWRVGVITKVLSRRKYNVYFEHGNEDKELSYSDIRPHAEWIDGKWITKSKEILVDSPNEQEQLGKVCDGTYHQGLAAPQENSDATKEKTEQKTPYSTNINDLMKQSNATHDTSLLTSSNKIELTTPNANSCSRLSKRLRTENTTDASLATTIGQLKRRSNEETSEEAVLSTFKTGAAGTRFSKKTVESNQLLAKTESVSAMMTTKTKRLNVGPLGSQIIDIVKRSARARKSPSKSLLVMATGREGNGSKAEHINEDEGKIKGIETPIILGLKAKVAKISRAKISTQVNAEESLELTRDRKSNANSSAGSKSMEMEKHEHGVSSQRRKRGRPRKLVVTIAKESNAVIEQNGEKLADEEMVEKGCRNQKTALRAYEGTELTERTEASEADGKTKESELALVNISSRMDEDKPLSTWFGEIRPSIVEEPKLASRGTSNELNETQGQDITVVDHAIFAKGETALDGSQILSLEKKCPVWKIIESFDAFQTIPQNPHFLPLAEIKDEFREGSAIGIMISYSSLFEKISSLQFDDPRSIFDSILDSLDDLERHGFDVALLRDRLNELSSIRDGQDQLLEEAKDAENKIAESMDEVAKYEEEMDEIKSKIAELEEQLAVVKSKKESMNLDIASLRRCIDAVHERLEIGRQDFKTVASAPWKLP